MRCAHLRGTEELLDGLADTGVIDGWPMYPPVQ